MRRFDLAMPESVDACVAALAELSAETRPVAGGTDLLPQMKNALVKPARVVDLSGAGDLSAPRSPSHGCDRIEQRAGGRSAIRRSAFAAEEVSRRG